MFVKTCPFHPGESATVIGGRDINCPIAACKFNSGNICVFLQDHETIEVLKQILSGLVKKISSRI